MFDYHFDPDRRPVFFIKGFPVWVATILVVLHSVMLIAISTTRGHLAVDLGLTGGNFFGDGVIWPRWWTWGTYFLVNGPDGWFLLDMYFLWMFGRELEQRMGRKFFLQLYGLLVAVGSLVTFAGLATGWSNYVVWMGPGVIHFSVFMAIAFLEPDAPVFLLNIKLKFVAAASLAVYMLRYIQAGSGIGCAVLGLSVVGTYFIMRRNGLMPRFTRMTEAVSAALPRPGRKKKTPRALPYEAKMLPRLQVREDRTAVEKIDAILEKISRTGVESLDEWERKELDRASRELKRQDS